VIPAISLCILRSTLVRLVLLRRQKQLSWMVVLITAI
jgi:hypothetical protein